MSHSFSVILEPEPSGGFSVLVPALPEAVTEADTGEEALVNAGEAYAAPDFVRAGGTSGGMVKP